MTKVLKSFNEGIDILFDPIEHTYHYKDRQFLSASSFIKDYTEEFDSIKMAYMVSEKTGVSQATIVDVWSSNGNIAAGFGTAIHNVLEHYYKYKEVGAKMKETNAAMPNHPFLRQLITELDKIKVDGETHQEVLISHQKKNICGQVDDLLILDAKKKICRIRDYKITADILVEKGKLGAPFHTMKSNKLSKNYIQLAFYSYMMMAAGWKVEGIDIFNWNGEWTKYSLESTELGVLIMLISGTYVK